VKQQLVLSVLKFNLFLLSNTLMRSIVTFIIVCMSLRGEAQTNKDLIIKKFELQEANAMLKEDTLKRLLPNILKSISKELESCNP
jgi:hypothetical protein